MDIINNDNNNNGNDAYDDDDYDIDEYDNDNKDADVDDNDVDECNNIDFNWHRQLQLWRKQLHTIAVPGYTKLRQWWWQRRTIQTNSYYN